MCKNIQIKWKENEPINFIFLNIEPKFTDHFAQYVQSYWTDDAVVRLFDILFEKGSKNIYVLSSSTNLETDACQFIKDDLKKEENSIKYLLGLFKDGQPLAADTSNVIIMEKSYLSDKLEDKMFFSTLTHELVHYIDELITGDKSTCFYSKLKETTDFNSYRQQVSSFVESKKENDSKNQGKVKPYSDFVMSEDEHELLTYCVEAYIIALCYYEDSKGEISDAINKMVTCAVNTMSTK